MTEGGEAGLRFARRAPRSRSRRSSSLSARIVIYDSVRLGVGWDEATARRPGYFPFYVGLIICIASLVNIVRALRVPAGEEQAVRRASAS